MRYKYYRPRNYRRRRIRRGRKIRYGKRLRGKYMNRYRKKYLRNNLRALQQGKCYEQTHVYTEADNGSTVELQFGINCVPGPGHNERAAQKVFLTGVKIDYVIMQTTDPATEVNDVGMIVNVLKYNSEYSPANNYFQAADGERIAWTNMYSANPEFITTEQRNSEYKWYYRRLIYACCAYRALQIGKDYRQVSVYVPINHPIQFETQSSTIPYARSEIKPGFAVFLEFIVKPMGLGTTGLTNDMTVRIKWYYRV